MYLEVVSQLGFGDDLQCSAHSHVDVLSELRELLSPAGYKSMIVEISGDRWSGKTTLLRDFAMAASRAGRLVAAGSAASPPRGTAFDVFIDALSELVDRYCIDLRRVLSPEHIRVLATIFPSLATISSDAFHGDSSEIYKVFHAIRGLVNALSDLGDLVLLLDDMHWAGDESVSMLGYLLRYPPERPVVIVVVNRPRQAGTTLLSLLSAGVANGTVRRLVLGPLPRDRALALLPADFSYRQCAALLDESGGNPGLLMGLASLQTGYGSSDGAYARLPRDVLAACLREFRTLSGLAMGVAQAIAVLGGPAELETARRVARVDDAGMWAAIDELTEEDLISFDSRSNRLRFVNPLLRMAARQSAGQGWLLSAHARAVEVLSSSRKAVSLIARHVECGAAIDGEGGARILLAAACEIIWQDPAQAARWIRAAQTMNAAASDTGCDRYFLLGKALALAGRLTEAREILAKVTDQAPAASPVRAEIACWRARVCFLNGSREEAYRTLDAALAALPPEHARSAAQLRRTRVELALDSGTPPEKDDKICLIRYLGSATGLQAAHVAGILAAATCHQSGTRAGHYATDAARSFDESADDEVAQHLEGLYRLARAESILGRYDVAFQHCERGLRLAEERRIGLMVPEFAAALGGLQLSAGDVTGATRHAACARTAAAATGSDHLMTIAAALEGRIRDNETETTEHKAGGHPADPAVERQDMSAQAVNPVADAEPDRYQAAAGKLSERETEIAFLVSYGKTNQQIARLLGLSHKTVETYLARTFNKLTVSCRAEVAAIISRAEITPPHSPALSACQVPRTAGSPPRRD